MQSQIQRLHELIVTTKDVIDPSLLGLYISGGINIEYAEGSESIGIANQIINDAESEFKKHLIVRLLLHNYAYMYNLDVDYTDISDEIIQQEIDVCIKTKTHVTSSISYSFSYLMDDIMDNYEGCRLVPRNITDITNRLIKFYNMACFYDRVTNKLREVRDKVQLLTPVVIPQPKEHVSSYFTNIPLYKTVQKKNPEVTALITMIENAYVQNYTTYTGLVQMK